MRLALGGSREGSGLQWSIGSMSLRLGRRFTFPALMASARATKAAIFRRLAAKTRKATKTLWAATPLTLRRLGSRRSR
jgi:hypothetical protein